MSSATQNPLQRTTEKYTHSEHTTRAFFALLAAHCFVALRECELWFDVDRLNYHPVWSVCWIPIHCTGLTWLLFTLLGLATSAAAARFVMPQWLRILAACCFFMHCSMEDSRDAIRHNEHALLWTAAIFAFFPDMSSTFTSRRKQLTFLRVFVTAQILFLVFYWMAGAVKVLTSIAQGIRGERTLLNPDSGALIIAEWLLRGDTTSLVGRWLIEHKYVAWIFVLCGVLVELAAVLPVFWRWSQPFVACGLIAMHICIGLSMDVWFPENVALLALLLLAGPTIAARR